jgi:lysophospholipase L1-like esterase
MSRWPLAWVAAAPIAPWLMVQGRRVRRVIPVLPEPPGDRHGRWRLAGPRGRASTLPVLLLGDSSMAGVGASHQHQALSGALGALVHQPEGSLEVAWQVQARTGWRTRDSLAALSAAAVAEHAAIVVVALGVNDVTALQSARGFRADVRRLSAYLRDIRGARRVFWCGLPPVHRFSALPQPLRAVLGRKAIELDAVLRALGPDYLPMPAQLDDDWIASDGFHPGPLAYQAWARAIAPDLREAIFQAAGFHASIGP